MGKDSLIYQKQDLKRKTSFKCCLLFFFSPGPIYLITNIGQFEFHGHGDDGRGICPLLPVSECSGVHAFTDRSLPSDSVSDSIFHKVSKSFRQPRNRYKCMRKLSFHYFLIKLHSLLQCTCTCSGMYYLKRWLFTVSSICFLCYDLFEKQIHV